MKMKNIKPAIVLTTICIVVALLLAAVNLITAPKIEEYEYQKQFESLRQIIEDGVFEDPVTPDGKDESFKIYKDKNGKGSVVTLTTRGYADAISMTVGVDPEGKVIKVIITSEKESHGKPASEFEAYLNRLVGLDDSTIGSVEMVSGATATSTAIKNAVAEAVAAVTGAAPEDKPEEFPTSEADIKTIVEELVGKSVTLTATEPEGVSEFAKRVYKISDGLGYAAYIITNTEWNEHEAEAVVTFDKGGKVTGTKLLAWNLSSTYVHKDIPGDDFVAGLVGKDESTLPSVELITHVTETSGRFRDAVLSLSTALASPADEAIVSEILGKEVKLEEITPEGISPFVKQVYEFADKTGYSAHIITNTEWNTHEAEAVVTFDNYGEVTGIKLLAWNLSPTYEHKDIPGDDFAASLVGKDGTTLGDVELVTHVTQTSGRLRDAVSSVSAAVGEPTHDMIASEILGKTVTLEPITKTGVSSFVKQIYKLSDKSGYAAHIITNTEWNTHEAEAVVTFDNYGEVTGIKLLAWNLSPTYEHNDIPGDDFAASLVGKDGATLGDVELVTHVTQTSGRLRDAVASVSAAVGYPTSESEITAIVGTLLSKDNVTLTVHRAANVDEFVKRVYKLSDGSGYAAYIITNTEWNTHEAEAVVTFDNNGKVTGVKLLAWNLSPTYEHKDIPGDTFAASLVGKDSSSLGDVELITHVTQTSGRLRDSVKSVAKSILPTSESVIFATADEIFRQKGEYTNVTPADALAGVKRIYKSQSGAYIAYIVTSTQWNAHEAEMIVAVGANGKIAGVKLLAWNLSPTYEHKDIPGDSFAASLVGCDKAGVEAVELVTHVTETSTRVRDALAAAMDTMEFRPNYAPRIVGVSIAVLALAITIAFIVIKRRVRK